MCTFPSANITHWHWLEKTPWGRFQDTAASKEWDAGCTSIVIWGPVSRIQYSIYSKDLKYAIPEVKLIFQLPIISIVDSSRKLVFFGGDRELINNSCCYCTSEDGWNTRFLQYSLIMLYTSNYSISIIHDLTWLARFCPSMWCSA